MPVQGADWARREDEAPTILSLWKSVTLNPALPKLARVSTNSGILTHTDRKMCEEPCAHVFPIPWHGALGAAECAIILSPL